MSKPLCVLISDIHFTPNTLYQASFSLSQAQQAAKRLGVPLVIAGDTLDTKAVMRAECVNALIMAFKKFINPPKTYIIVGNHDLLNEKGEAHSLEFLKPYVTVVDRPYREASELPFWMLPYSSNGAELAELISRFEKGSTIICHQGVQTAYMGHYMQDKTSLPKEAFADFRVISGHYHRRQDIKCGRPRAGAIGLFSYIGNPYTLSFGEANDPEKGYQVLHDDGLLEFKPLGLRKHVVIEKTVEELANMGRASGVSASDPVWLKVTGNKSQLDSLDKSEVGMRLFDRTNYKLDLIPTENESVGFISPKLAKDELLDSLIDKTSESDEFKAYLKELWRSTLADT